MSQNDTNGDDEHRFEGLAENIASMMAAGIVARTLRAASSEEYRQDLKRRSELRKELSAPEWFPDSLKPYYNIATWRGRLSMLVLDLSVWTPVNWHRYPVLNRMVSWAVHTDAPARWEVHEEWPA